MGDRLDEAIIQLSSCIEFLKDRKGFENSLARGEKILREVSEETIEMECFQGIVKRFVESVDYYRGNL